MVAATGCPPTHQEPGGIVNTTAATDVGAVVLAGGLARRMGGDDKGLIPLAGRPMVAHVIAAIQPAVAALVINANRNHDRYAQYGVPIVKDAHADYPGPLAGLAAGIEALGTSLVFMCPCDSPFVSAALVNTLVDGIGDADVSAAHDGDRLQPVFAVVRSHCAQSLLAFLASGERKIDRWYAGERFVAVDASEHRECFENINTANELAKAERAMAGGDRGVLPSEEASS